ncbi:hypothetical protein CCACVL1_24484 [Corchorus capsularis]|uniref:Uncharacterized protein n=1 Tax=Corchorus capsularis TaxID=210143 RepID=A0A1R3GPJ4_COCAP|nr:hypothetical protein CCACVL1_24484 [Corchorus capsularis]
MTPLVVDEVVVNKVLKVGVRSLMWRFARGLDEEHVGF